MSWKGKNRPFEAPFRTARLERAHEFGGRLLIDSEVLASHYTVEFATEKLLRTLGASLRMRATALYGYARFEGDDQARLTFSVPKTSYRRVLASGWDYLRAWMCNYLNFINSIFKDWHARHVKRVGWYNNPVNLGLPKRWQPRYETLEFITREDWDENIERIQEGLVAQVMLLRKYGLEPQAVLACPDIAHNLIAAAWSSGYSAMDVTISGHGHGQFMGLTVIPVRELKWGAIVV